MKKLFASLMIALTALVSLGGVSSASAASAAPSAAAVEYVSAAVPSPVFLASEGLSAFLETGSTFLSWLLSACGRILDACMEEPMLAVGLLFSLVLMAVGLIRRLRHN